MTHRPLDQAGSKTSLLVMGSDAIQIPPQPPIAKDFR